MGRDPHGGFYTQDDIREIVAYAAERHIRVVPEIDIPGHSQAAISAYPELGNTDVVDTTTLTVWDTWGVNPNVLAPTDTTLRFFEGVLEELLELFPAETSPFVHIGGDECPKDQWKASPPPRPGSPNSACRTRRASSPGSSATSTPGSPPGAAASSAGTRSWRAASPKGPPSPPGAVTPAASRPPRPGTTW